MGRSPAFYKTEKGQCDVDEFLDSLPSKVEKVTWVLKLVRSTELYVMSKNPVVRRRRHPAAPTVASGACAKRVSRLLRNVNPSSNEACPQIWDFPLTSSLTSAPWGL